jgi:dipeptidyl aminopeptidase/acylaminoacyl peptidase
MSLNPGTHLGPYEIVSAIGAGGMGEVYRATDTNLGREVAIKVLPEAFAQDADRLARFEREARTLASLNHPNIAIIHGLEKSQGTYALVMELVEGEDLSQRIAGGPIPIDEALPIAKQIAEALEAAHEQGIIHRDLKPANIKVRPDGTVKVLDFGLAKLNESTGQRTAGSLSLSPTITSPALVTGVGVLLGTAAYMAPEQAKGKPADRRSDMWAFGCVLYEMLTGSRPFAGDDVTDTLVAVLGKDPIDLRLLPASVPVGVRTLIRRCLEKDRRRRLESAADARLEIDDAVSFPAADVQSNARTPSTMRIALYASAAMIAGALVATALTWMLLRPPSASEPVARLMLTTPATLPLAPFGFDRDIALSSDGSFVVYRAGGQGQLALRRFDRLDVAPIDVRSARQPVVSPDNHWIAYVDSEAFTLKKVPVSGGSPITLARLPSSPRGAAWLDDGNIIVAASNPTVGLMRVAANGGEPATLTTPDQKRGEIGHWWPSVLPGGRAVLFTIAADSLDKDQIAVLDLDTGKYRTVLSGGSHAQYVRSGHLIYAFGYALYAVRFDLARRAVVGEPVRVVDGVAVSTLGAANAAISQAGTLMYLPSDAGEETPRVLVWVDRQGHETPLAVPARAYVCVRLSPDGTRAVLNTYDGQSDLWTLDLTRQTLTRLTFDPAIDLDPIWSPDGRRIFFASNRAGAYNLYVREADGTGSDQRIAVSDNATYPISIAPDQSFLFGGDLGSHTGYDLFRLPLRPSSDADATHGRTADHLLQTPAMEYGIELSPDGHFIAYQSDESGRFEIYVRPYPKLTDGRWQVSTNGGRMPLWSRDGHELLYLDGNGRLTSVSVDTSATSVRAGTPMTLLHTTYSTPDVSRSYDMSPDGRRFLMIKDSNATPRNIVVVQHFDQELRQLVPSK